MFYQRIKRFPWIAATTRRHLAIELFQKQTAKMLLTWTLILACFAGAIAIGVVYNNARIALETRARDFTSLRVLGFSEAEVFRLMASEQILHLMMGIPVGLFLGHILTKWLYTTVESELFRIPVIISARTQINAVVILLAAALVSRWSVRQRIAKLDLVAVLKARD